MMDNIGQHRQQASKLFLRKSVYVTVLFVCVSFALICKDVTNGRNGQGLDGLGANRMKRETNKLENDTKPEPTNNNLLKQTTESAVSIDPSNSIRNTSTKGANNDVDGGSMQSPSTTSTTISTTRTSTTKGETASTTTSTEKETLPSTTSSTTVTTIGLPSKGPSITTTSKPIDSSVSTTAPCEPPAYHEFPDDLFTNRQRKQGFVVVHILVGLYMLFALAVVCDEYFVASMEKICSKLGLSEDVAGATFMAAGSSAPELFASLLGVFVAKGDVGTGTIVGSAVFNILFVIGFCAIFAGKVVALNWWPLIRDSTYYSIAVVVLISIMADGVVTWWESLLMLIFYGIYIIIMKFNLKIHIWLTENTRLRLMDEFTQSSQGILLADGKPIESSYVKFNNTEEEACASGGLVKRSPREPREMPMDEIIRDYPRKWSLYESALKVMHSRRFSPRTRFICAALRVIEEWKHLRRYGYPMNKQITINQFDDVSNSGRIIPNSIPYEEWKRAPSIAEIGIFGVIRWGFTSPLYATLHYTIPDCRDPGWEKWFLLTFTFSMVWIAFFSYILVWMVTLIGYTFGIPDTVMGITFLAAGTSIPDAYSSLLVAKQGLGDMAVSNSIGSNVFDILIGLALPWFLQTAIVEPGSKVRISSGGMVFNVILLFLSIIATITAVHYARWQLNQRLGIWLMLAYAIFLLFSLLIEFNVFGNVNLPECQED